MKNQSYKKFTIIGSGFGLYGYLPAIIRSKNKIILAEQYKQKIELREELRRYLKYIDWCASLEIAMNNADSIVVAVLPDAQEKVVHQILGRPNIKHIILEKPLCPSPKDSRALLEKILEIRKQFRINYTFLETDWYNVFKKKFKINNIKINIKWFFKANHIRNNINTWKQDHVKGGGPLRFYGIHLIAILASLKYNETIYSALIKKNNIIIGWIAVFSGNNIPNCEVQVFTNSDQDEFRIEATNINSEIELIYFNKSPLKTRGVELGELDGRVIQLERLISSFDLNDDEYIKLYKNINNLWDLVELKLET